MHDVTIGTQAKKVASSWDELSQQQLVRLMPIVYGQYPTEQAQRVHLLPVLLGISPALLLSFTDVQVVQLLPLTEFLLAKDLVFTRQLVPVLNRGWYKQRLWGPGDELGGVSFLEFVFADSYFMAYVRSQDKQWLYHLIATLYRPERRPYRPNAADYAGDRRQNFNQHLIERRLPAVAGLPEVAHLAILTWYRGCRHALEQRYPLVFTSENEQAAQQPGGWDHVLREMSGAAFGSFAETGRQPAHQLLAKMQDDAQQAERLKRDAQSSS